MDKILELMLTRIENLEKRVMQLESRPVVEHDDRPATTKLLEYLKDNQIKKEKDEELNR
tara:strand:+ start:1408 stop:1584 length:177 start_codon:yes stop_codon:yes gene_type:complete